MSDINDDDVISSRNDLEMLKRPHLWPGQMPSRIYVKRGHQDGKGYTQTGPCIMWGRNPDEYVIQAHDWSDNGSVSTLRYDSAEDVIADGWIVD